MYIELARKSVQNAIIIHFIEWCRFNKKYSMQIYLKTFVLSKPDLVSKVIYFLGMERLSVTMGRGRLWWYSSTTITTR